MNRLVTEKTMVFMAVIKWFFLATLVGIIVGISTTIFLTILNLSTTVSKFNLYYLFMPLAFALSSLLILLFTPELEGRGTDKVIESIHKQHGKISPLVAPVKLVSSVLTIAFGGSAGKEGPAAQIGSSLSSWLGDLLNVSNADRKKLVICGISAGFAAVFGTPFAGAIFGVEILFVGSLLYEVLLPSFIAGLTAYQVSSGLGITYFYHPLQVVPKLSELFLIKVLIAGIFFGICALLLIEIMSWGKALSRKIPLSTPLKGLIAGCVLIFLTILFSTKYLGLGLETIEGTLRGEAVSWYDFILKSIFTSITLNFGGSGGILTPILFVGSTAGSLFASWFSVDPATFAALGFIAVLAGATNAPIAASIMAMELFGTAIAPYAAAAAIVSFLVTGYKSVFPSQILSIQKSESLEVIPGTTIREAKPTLKMNDKRFLGIISRIEMEGKKLMNKSLYSKRKKSL